MNIYIDKLLNIFLIGQLSLKKLIKLLMIMLYFTLIYKSFFSYLGAHRYGSTGLPWGHLRMSNEEYKSYVDNLFPNRSNAMKSFFFEDI